MDDEPVPDAEVVKDEDAGAPARWVTELGTGVAVGAMLAETDLPLARFLGAVVPAAAGVVYKLDEQLWKRRIIRGSQVVEQAAEQLNLTVEEVIDQSASSERHTDLFTRVLDAAGNATMFEGKLESLGAALAMGLADETRIDDAAMYALVIRDLEIAHIRVLRVLMAAYPPYGTGIVSQGASRLLLGHIGFLRKSPDELRTRLYYRLMGWADLYDERVDPLLERFLATSRQERLGRAERNGWLLPSQIEERLYPDRRNSRDQGHTVNEQVITPAIRRPPVALGVSPYVKVLEGLNMVEASSSVIRQTVFDRAEVDLTLYRLTRFGLQVAHFIRHPELLEKY